MPPAFFVVIVGSLRFNIRLFSAKADEAGLTSPSDESGGRYYISYKAKPILQAFPKSREVIPHKFANEVS